LTLSGADTIQLSADATISAPLAGSGGFTVNSSGSSLLTLGNSSNTITGPVAIAGGGIKLGAAAALAGDTLSSAYGGIFDLNGNPVSNSLTLDDFDGAIINSSSTAASFAGSINTTTANDFAVDGSHAITLSGAIGDSGGGTTLWMVGSAKLTLSGT